MVQTVAIADPSSNGEVAVQFLSESKAFNALQFLGLIGSVLSLVTALFSSIPRQATWYNFFISWIVFCISYLLLFFAGHAYGGEPELYLCIAQSSLTYAASPFAASCCLALVIQLYLNIQATLNGKFIRGKRYMRIVLLITPYIIFISVMIESLAVNYGSTLTLTETLIIPNSKMSFATNVKFSSVSYCSLENHLPGRITAALVIILIVPMLVLNLLIYLSFRKHRSFLQEGNYTSMFVRVSAFTLCGLISVIVGLFFFLRAFIGGGDSNQGLVELDIILAMAPVSAVVIFGTHKDLLNVWLFWRNQTPIAKKVENPVPPLSNVHIEYEVVIE
ncbi:hypothetical protein DFJ43DRAFT_488370 [Lentinula guzmanii]|uniref:Uncharacterized protein n=1 Tax=Lentinula guzmanii TaxID=2804957 RepID=A0AA38JH97_9AGAR|nr:hypothetical protein DFJ43DRAFT_488370 [Lentinula guzmanii]